MDLSQQINEDIKQAMLAKDKRKLEALRAIKAALLILKTGKDIGTAEIPKELELKTLQRLIKQRKESSNIYKEQGRSDLFEEEIYQARIIEAYLPQQLSEEEIREGVKEIIAVTGASSAKDMGKVMGASAKKFAGKADNKIISSIVKEILGA
ncbi:MAG: glutamyl-tRNA amidotransferase [Bacteroidetes bacterium CG2_30_33_31]|nr:MAG: glutamyl-tRNA amidotransferase [Bacteroidetes bacterium CG2_30_33_31]